MTGLMIALAKAEGFRKLQIHNVLAHFIHYCQDNQKQACRLANWMAN